MPFALRDLANGRQPGSEPGNLGSTPSPAANLFSDGKTKLQVKFEGENELIF